MAAEAVSRVERLSAALANRSVVILQKSQLVGICGGGAFFGGALAQRIGSFKNAGTVGTGGKIRRTELKKRYEKCVEVVVFSCDMKRLVAAAAGASACLGIACGIYLVVGSEKSDKEHSKILRKELWLYNNPQERFGQGKAKFKGNNLPWKKHCYQERMSEFAFCALQYLTLLEIRGKINCYIMSSWHASFRDGERTLCNGNV